MEIKYSKQAEEMINKLENKEAVKKILEDMARKRQIYITGGDVVKFLVSGKLLEKIGED